MYWLWTSTPSSSIAFSIPPFLGKKIVHASLESGGAGADELDTAGPGQPRLYLHDRSDSGCTGRNARLSAALRAAAGPTTLTRTARVERLAPCGKPACVPAPLPRSTERRRRQAERFRARGRRRARCLSRCRRRAARSREARAPNRRASGTAGTRRRIVATAIAPPAACEIPGARDAPVRLSVVLSAAGGPATRTACATGDRARAANRCVSTPSVRGVPSCRAPSAPPGRANRVRVVRPGGSRQTGVLPAPPRRGALPQQRRAERFRARPRSRARRSVAPR